jgi:multiple sugar transport system substrate-binding protein
MNRLLKTTATATGALAVVVAMAACGSSTSSSSGAPASSAPAAPASAPPSVAGSASAASAAPAGSSAPASSADTAGAGQTITVWTAEDPKLFGALMATFTKATGIKVNVDAVPWSNLDDKLTTAIASGNGPDVVQVGLSNVTDFTSANALLDLTPYLKDHPDLADSNFLPGIASSKTSPAGKVLSVPWVSDVRVLFYRSDILTTAGITAPPTTWTDLFNDATTLAKRGTGKYGFYIPQWDQALPIELTWQAGGDVTDSTGKVSFDTPAFKTAADFYTSFYKNKLVPTASDFDQTQGFISGAAPMLISGPYLAAAINGAAPALAGKWNVAPLPTNKTGTSLFGGSNMGIWSKSTHVQADLRLLDFLDQTSSQLAWWKSADELPTTNAALADPTLASDPMAQVYVKQLQDAELLPVVPKWSAMNQDALDALNSIALKGSDETSTLATLNTTISGLQQ